MLLTDKGKLLLSFFCHNVEEAIASMLASLEEGGFIKTVEDENGEKELIKVV